MLELKKFRAFASVNYKNEVVFDSIEYLEDGIDVVVIIPNEVKYQDEEHFNDKDRDLFDMISRDFVNQISILLKLNQFIIFKPKKS